MNQASRHIQAFKDELDARGGLYSPPTLGVVEEEVVKKLDDGNYQIEVTIDDNDDMYKSEPNAAGFKQSRDNDVDDNKGEEPQSDETVEPTQPPTELQSPNKPKKEGSRLDKRVQGLTSENRYLKEQLAQYQQQVQESHAANTQRLQQIATENTQLREGVLDMEKTQTINALRLAKENGDVDLELQLTDQLQRINAAIIHQQSNPHQYGEDAVISTPIAPTQYPPYQENYFHERDSQFNSEPDYLEPWSQEPELMQNWLSQNPWANRFHPNFDSKLTTQVADVFSKLDNFFNYNGQSQEIYSQKYFDMATDIMNQSWKVNNSSGESQQMAPSEGSQPKQTQKAPTRMVAPVSRPGGSMAEQYISQDDRMNKHAVVLSPQMIELARRSRIPTVDQYGRETIMTPDQAVQHFAKIEHHRQRTQRG